MAETPASVAAGDEGAGTTSTEGLVAAGGGGVGGKLCGGDGSRLGGGTDAGDGVAAGEGDATGEGDAAAVGAGCGSTANVVSAVFRFRPPRRRSTRGAPFPDGTKLASTRNETETLSPGATKRHVRMACSSASAQGEAPLVTAASTTSPRGSSVTSAVTVDV